MHKNTRSRKYLLTINNPIEKCYTHEKICAILAESNTVYYCLCDETGENGTPHTHVYVYYENAVYFDTMKKRFPEAHIDKANGSSQQNRDYIRKEGKYLDSDKKETNHIETFEEYGEIPLDKSSKNESVSEQVLQMVKDGYTNIEIIDVFPSYSTKIIHLDRLRQEILQEEYKNKRRDVEVHYIYGDTGTGKTRYVMEKYGYDCVYKVTNYKNPFDKYSSEPVLLLDEFRSSLPISDLLQYLDIYPCRLPARYEDKTACYTKVFIISNYPLDKQYIDIQLSDKETWNAFIRRIDNITRYERNKNIPFSDNEEVIQIEEFSASYIITEGVINV